MLGEDDAMTNHGAVSSLTGLGAGGRQHGDNFSLQNFNSNSGVFGLLPGGGFGGEVRNDSEISGRAAAIRASGQSLHLVNTGLISVVNGTGGAEAIDNQELAGGGTDTVLSEVLFSLGDFREKRAPLGADDINGSGDDLVNMIDGNNGKDMLNGGAEVRITSDGGDG